MANKQVRVALIGAGSMANGVHYPSLAEFDDVDIVALCDLDKEKLHTTADKFAIDRRFTDYREMLDKSEPDAVYILMPPHQLFDVAMDVMERGHDLFMEKPPGVTTFQTENLARMAERKSLISGVGFQRRYHPLVHSCWEEVKKRGELHQLSVSFYKNMPPQEVYAYYRGSVTVLHSDVIHAVDSVRYYAGLSPFATVKSEVRKLDCWYDSAFTAMIEFENGALGVLLANWRTGRRMFLFEFNAYNAMAIAEIDDEGRVWADNANDPVYRKTVAEAAGAGAYHKTQGFFAQARAFIDSVKSRSPLHNSLQDSVESMRLADAILAESQRRSG